MYRLLNMVLAIFNTCMSHSSPLISFINSTEPTTKYFSLPLILIGTLVETTFIPLFIVLYSKLHTADEKFSILKNLLHRSATSLECFSKSPECFSIAVQNILHWFILKT